MNKLDYYRCNTTCEYLKHIYSVLKHLQHYLQDEQPTRSVKSYFRQFCEEMIKEIDRVFGNFEEVEEGDYDGLGDNERRS